MNVPPVPAAIRGFTLIELIMAIVLIGVLAGLSAPIISQGLGASEVTRNNLQSQNKLRLLLQRLEYEIREIDHDGSGYLISTMTAGRLVFNRNDAPGTQVDIGFAGSAVTIGYSSPALSAVLSDEVNSFTLAYYDSNNASTTDTAALAFVEVAASLRNPQTGAVYPRRMRIALRDRG